MTRSTVPGAEGVELLHPPDGRRAEVLTPDALAFVAALERELGPRRRELLARRAERRDALAAGAGLDFLDETREVREGDWTVGPVPGELQERRVEITGPVERKMVINALNSGASGFMADFEDALSPTWDNVTDGHVNLIDAVRRTIDLTGPDGRRYELADDVATLHVRPRGLHLTDHNVLVDGEPVTAALLDLGLFAFHNAGGLLDRGSGPWFYLPKLESHLEARWFNDAFVLAQDALGIPRGTFKATVLIETVPAAFEMDEILFELREHAVALNAGRWDYIFSMIKSFRERPEMVLPDRDDVKMTVPFMQAYTDLVVRTCHRRGAHAMGGMAAVIPSRRDPERNARATELVRADKRREAQAGFDGTWVAHPDVVGVAREEFDRVLGDRPNQVDRQRDDVRPDAAALLDVAATPGTLTERGLRANVDVAVRYLSAWLRGQGAVGIHGLMEDAATAEIARAQVWQWIRHGSRLDDGRTVTRDLVARILDEERASLLAEAAGDAAPGRESRIPEAAALFEEVALADELPEFLTLPAYERLG